MTDIMEKPVIVTQADSFVVVIWVQPKSGDGKRGWYDYETYDTLDRAEAWYRDYEAGEYPGNSPVCIFASKNGIPIGRIV